MCVEKSQFCEQILDYTGWGCVKICSVAWSRCRVYDDFAAVLSWPPFINGVFMLKKIVVASALAMTVASASLHKVQQRQQVVQVGRGGSSWCWRSRPTVMVGGVAMTTSTLVCGSWYCSSGSDRRFIIKYKRHISCHLIQT